MEIFCISGDENMGESSYKYLTDPDMDPGKSLLPDDSIDVTADEKHMKDPHYSVSNGF